MKQRVVEVAAAVIQRADRSFLLAQRPQGKVYEGFWEFPGGKIEPGERPDEALARELKEELGLELTRCYPWLTRTHAYPHATVRLHFLRVSSWKGKPYGRERQLLAWQRPGETSESPMLPANAPILKALQLPNVYAISCASTLGVPEALRRLDHALASGLRLVQLRDKDMSRDARREFAHTVAVRCAAAGARLMVNDDEELATAISADGIHCSSARLRSLHVRPDFEWCAASCHDAEELQMAADLGLDFVVIGPVKPTASHASASPMGWSQCADLLRGYSLPAYALGGLRMDDLETAWNCGAHGVALMSAAWQL